MLKRLYQEELALLKELGDEFAAAHPALAPMLAGPGGDPAVERFLEGTAFSAALLRQRLDDDFPEIVHRVSEELQPWSLRSIPSTSIVAFTVEPGIVQTQYVRAGTELASVSVEGTKCRFRTCYDVEVHPLSLLDASFAQIPGQSPCIKLQMELAGTTVSEWQPQMVRFFLGNDYTEACDLYLLLMRYVKRVVIRPLEAGAVCTLPSECLKPVGFSVGETLLPGDSRQYLAHLGLQEWFFFPNKHLFVDLTSLDRWKNRGAGSRFEINFELTSFPFAMPPIRKESFILSATPVINLFHHLAKTIETARDTPQRIYPLGKPVGHYQIYSIDQVSGIEKETLKKATFSSRSSANRRDTETVYEILHTKSPVSNDREAVMVLAKSDETSNAATFKLRIELTCSNGWLPECLGIGDIAEATIDTPGGLTFRNITPVTNYLLMPEGQNGCWQLLSNLSLNKFSLGMVEAFRAIIGKYNLAEGNNQCAQAANERRILGICPGALPRLPRGRT
jgi:type VI secretion system protein ImpG